MRALTLSAALCVVLYMREARVASDASPQFAHVTFLIWFHLKSALIAITLIKCIHGRRPSKREEKLTEN